MEKTKNAAVCDGGVRILDEDEALRHLPRGVVAASREVMRRFPRRRHEATHEAQEDVVEPEGEKEGEPEYAQMRLVDGVWKGDYSISAAFSRDVDRHRRLSSDEEDRLLKKYIETKDPMAFDRLVTCNLRLVCKLANQYARMYKVPFLDVVQDGSMGLMRAIRGFSFAKECRLGTYAIWWIRQSITRGIMDTNSTIRLPVHTQEILQKADKVTLRLMRAHGKEPTEEEIAKELKISVARLRLAREHFQKIFSANVTMSGSEDDSCFIDFIQDERPLPDEQMYERELSQNVIAPLLQGMKPQYRMVMIMRHGLEGFIFSEREIVQAMNNQKNRVTLAKIREIELALLEKLNPPKEILFNRQAATEWLMNMCHEGLSPEEEMVFTLRYGIGASENALEAIAKGIKLTREGVRQIEKKAMDVIRIRIRRDILRSEREAGIYIEKID